METTMGAKWGMPAFGLLVGVLSFAASAVGGQPIVGVGMFAAMAIYSLVLLAFGGRSETVGVLRGQPADERLAGFNLAATAVAGLAAILVALGGFLWQIVHGQSGSDFALVAAASGIGYLVALVWFRWRGRPNASCLSPSTPAASHGTANGHRCRATDKAVNAAAPVSKSYATQLVFIGFLSPVANQPVVNVGTAGKTFVRAERLPVADKTRLDGTAGCGDDEPAPLEPTFG
jgi:hypothetical protein